MCPWIAAFFFLFFDFVPSERGLMVRQMSTCKAKSKQLNVEEMSVSSYFMGLWVCTIKRGNSQQELSNILLSKEKKCDLVIIRRVAL